MHRIPQISTRINTDSDSGIRFVELTRLSYHRIILSTLLAVCIDVPEFQVEGTVEKHTSVMVG